MNYIKNYFLSFLKLLIHPRTIQFYIFLLSPHIAFYFVEHLNLNELPKDLENWQIRLNLLLYYAIFGFFYLIIRYWSIAMAIPMVGLYLFGVANHYMYQFRERIIFPADFTAIRTALNVSSNYDIYVNHHVRVASLMVLGYLFLLFLTLQMPKKYHKSRPKWWFALILAVTLYSGYHTFFRTTYLTDNDIYVQQWNTRENGFLLNFTLALRYSAVEKPEGYSSDAVIALLEQFPATPEKPDVTKPVNIIAIMNESYADYALFEHLEFNENPTPFLHELMENSTSGTMFAPVFGGGTAQVEFEFLTGFTNNFLPAHTVPYQLYVTDGIPSIGQLTQADGYDTSAFHPFEASGWNRPIVYEYFNFNQQYYDYDVQDPYLVRNYISDLSAFDKIIEITQSNQGEPTFVFTVTMQNHGSYDQGWHNLSPEIEIISHDTSENQNAMQFFSLMRESDRALEYLIEYYQSIDEPTMIIHFGDHHPAFSYTFYDQVIGSEWADRTTYEKMLQYTTPFFIWTNYPHETEQDIFISPNFLGILAAEIAGLPMTNYMNFLADLRTKLPVITPVAVYTAEEEWLHEWEFVTKQLVPYQQYKMLNYAGLIDFKSEYQPYYYLE